MASIELLSKTPGWTEVQFAESRGALKVLASCGSDSVVFALVSVRLAAVGSHSL